MQRWSVFDPDGIMNGWKTVLATHEEAQKLSHGVPWLGDNFPGVALPSVKAHGRWVIVKLGDRWTCAQVMDVGPFCQDDDEYVFGTAIPRAQRLVGKPCPMTLADPSSRATLPDGREVETSNGAGIDLFPRIARQLDIPINDNVWVEWKFLEI